MFIVYILHTGTGRGDSPVDVHATAVVAAGQSWVLARLSQLLDVRHIDIKTRGLRRRRGGVLLSSHGHHRHDCEHCDNHRARRRGAGAGDVVVARHDDDAVLAAERCGMRACVVSCGLWFFGFFFWRRGEK